MNGAVLDPRLLAAALLACCAAALAAIAIPVPVPESDATASTAADLGESVPHSAPGEDLGAFLASRRWGLSLQEIEQTEQEATVINPVLAKMGFVGLIVSKDERAVLLRMPEGSVTRIAPGGTLPDGRTLVSVTDNELTLKAEGVPEEVLELFPRIRRAPPAGDGGDDAEGGEGSSGDAAAGMGAALPAVPGSGRKGGETLARSRAAKTMVSR